MPAWKPGPGNWFPRGEHSVAVNLLSHEDNYIGYFLLDTHLPVNPYEYIHIRFSNILWELSIMRNMRELNLDMSREIAARKESEEKLKNVLVRLEQTSIEDELTHLYNRRGFFTLAEQQVKYLRRQNDCYFILFTDLDGLKGINDRWGHQEGDVAIRSAARILRSALRDSDIVGRLGGDEFTALINKAQPPSFEAIKERIQYICDRENAELARPWKVSMSIGHFCAEPGCTLSVKEMLERADAELYEQKQLKKRC
jgi:diguanylate cyclase (GGDEF)-like protein